MANKRNKSRKQQRSRRSGVALAPTSPVAASEGAPAVASPDQPLAPRPQQSTASSRYASNVSGPRRAGAATATTGTIDIDERVPYFGKDLRRIVLTAAVMVVIIVGASFLLH